MTALDIEAGDVLRWYYITRKSDRKEFSALYIQEQLSGTIRIDIFDANNKPIPTREEVEMRAALEMFAEGLKIGGR